MKVIGRGWQYTVYDLGNGRVRKKFNTLFVAYTIMLRDAFRHMRPPVLRFVRYYNASKRTALDSLQTVSESSLEPWIFGNPKMLGACAYEQDYVTPISLCLKRSSLDEGKKIIEKFVEFNAMLLRNSMIEKYFNVADNFGLNASGNIMLIDLGEICTSKEEIQRQIQKRVWAAPDVLSELPDGLRAYFVEKMDAAFKI